MAKRLDRESKKIFFSKSDFFIILRALDFVKNINVNILVLLMQVLRQFYALKLVLSVNKRLNWEVAVRTINPFHPSWKCWYFTDWYLYRKSNNPCLFVCMSDHCSGTPKPICLKFWLRNSVDPWECSQLGLKVEWRELFYRIFFPGRVGFPS